MSKVEPYRDIEYVDIFSVGTGRLEGVSLMSLADAPSRAKRRRAGRKAAAFFFQAEDGIRHRDVTGVQTWALPIKKKKNPSET